MDVRFWERQEPPAERRKLRAGVLRGIVFARSSEARVRRILFSLDKRLTWTSANRKLARDKYREVGIATLIRMPRPSSTIYLSRSLGFCDRYLDAITE